MTIPALGRLEKVELRNAWLSEPDDFTPWLAQAENLRLLGEAINLDLELEAQGKNVGPFRADILCRDTAASDEHWVLIENQLERTDHIHLGQLLTYAAGSRHNRLAHRAGDRTVGAAGYDMTKSRMLRVLEIQFVGPIWMISRQ